MITITVRSIGHLEWMTNLGIMIINNHRRTSHNDKMRGMNMNHNVADHEWNKLLAHIDQMFGKYLRDGLGLIEYKPLHAVYLLEMPQDDRKDHPKT